MIADWNLSGLTQRRLFHAIARLVRPPLGRSSIWLYQGTYLAAVATSLMLLTVSTSISSRVIAAPHSWGSTLTSRHRLGRLWRPVARPERHSIRFEPSKRSLFSAVCGSMTGPGYFFCARALLLRRVGVRGPSSEVLQYRDDPWRRRGKPRTRRRALQKSG